MNDQTQTTEQPSDVELRALFQQAGGTIYYANREIGSMPIKPLLLFIRSLLQPGATVAALGATASPATPDSGYAKALIDLINAACPGLDTGNLFEDARKATAAFESAEPVAYFGVDEEGRHQQVKPEHANDVDIFPLYRRAPLEAEITAPASEPVKPAGKAGTKASGAKGGTS